MRPISWLHISDMHLRPRDAWPQAVVMDAMCDDISRQRAERAADFILVTGDLAFSGKVEEYALVGPFLDTLAAAAGVSKQRIFCIPGNHDIDRDCQKFCFHGARAVLLDQSSADMFLGAPAADDFRTLLQREQHYRDFQASYFAGQERTPTPDGLGYIARVCVDGVRLVIIGFDSAWLANGGADDQMKLLLGERQVIDALKVALEGDEAPHIFIAMAHHPLHLLQDFDRRPVQARIEGNCHFFHCGHLHEPEERPAGQTAAGCVTLTAGASFEGRQSPNTYSLVTLDLLRAQRTLMTRRFNPGSGAFSSFSTQTYRIEVSPTRTCDVGELAKALEKYMATPWPHYLAALLLDKKSEIPVPVPGGHTLASFAIIETLPPIHLREKTAAFFTFRNALRVLYGHENLEEILRQHGDAITQYSAALSALCTADPELTTRLNRQDEDARVFAATQPESSFAHTSALLAEHAGAHDWQALRDQAARHIDSAEPSLANQAKRMLALALANSDEASDKRRAIELYRSLVDGDSPDPTDAGNLATLLMEADAMDEAGAAILNGIAKGPATAADYFGRIGQRIVEATGDRKFRNRLKAALAERGRQ